MDCIADRIRKLIEALGIKKTTFAEKINVSQAFVTQITKGTSQPSDRTITDICKNFGVNEIWLREGVGEMFRKKSRNEELADFFGDLQFGDSGFKQAFVTVLARMGPEEWQMIERKARELAEEIKKADP